jgi:hypothetical protein
MTAKAQRYEVFKAFGIIFIELFIVQMRYRDNEVVSYKGEKVSFLIARNSWHFDITNEILRQVIIIKNPSDDYDGGSRGRVKTKGKRGPGWV